MTHTTVAHGSTFLLTDAEGAVSRPSDGFYFRDVQHLDTYAVRGDGWDLEVLDVVEVRPGERVVHLGDPLVDRARTLAIERRQVVTDRLCERFVVSNHSRAAIDRTLSLHVGTGFADVFEVRGYHDPPRSREVTAAPIDDDGGVRFDYDPAAVDVARTTAVSVDRSVEVEIDRAEATPRNEATLRVDFSLAPRETFALTVVVSPGEPRDPTDAFATAQSAVREREQQWNGRVDTPAVTDHEHRAVVRRSLGDLLALTIDTAYGPVFAAGTPWYATVFGRDALLAAYQVLEFTAAPAKATLRYLAAHQATTVDPDRDAEPGKVMHEIRRGELAARREIPHTPYYGSIDATPLWIVLLHETWERTGDDSLVDDLWSTFERALSWVERAGDRGDHGFLAYEPAAVEGGLRHRAWKDSDDGIVNPDGSAPEGPLAVAEVQGYCYDAMRRAADLYREVGDDAERAAELDARSADLARAFDEAFWLPGEAFYAVALDGGGGPVPSVTSNPGHCLWSGLVPDERAADVVDRLVADDLFSGWGIRTLSAEHAAYNPQSYHRGSVWPHDTSLAVLGMLAYDRPGAARTVASGLFDAAARSDSRRLPELFAGFDRDDDAPVPYGVECIPQAWAAGAPLACLRALDTGGRTSR